MKLSIITVNLNNIHGLQKTMESIFTQNSKDYEWVVIDGGSTDGSKELIEQNSKHIAYWVSEPDDGIYHAMNKGITAATGDYLQFLNSGDYLYSDDVYSSFIKLRLTADVVYGDAISVDSNGNETGHFIAPGDIRLSYFWSHRLNHQATFFHKRCFERFLYNETYRVVSDLELYMKLLYHAYSFQKWGKCIVCFQTGGISSEMTTEHLQELRAVYDSILPPGLKADYDEIIQNRDVDLYITIRRVISSERWIRNLTRLLLMPVKMFLK